MAEIVQFPTRDAHIWQLMETFIIEILERRHASQEMRAHICSRMKDRYMRCCAGDGFQCSGSEEAIRNALLDFFYEVFNNLLVETLHLEIDLYNATFGQQP